MAEKMVEQSEEQMDPRRPYATAYRPFRDADERIGAMRCSTAAAPWLRSRCRNPSVLVSYDPIGRTTLCERCAKKRGVPVPQKGSAA